MAQICSQSTEFALQAIPMPPYQKSSSSLKHTLPCSLASSSLRIFSTRSPAVFEGKPFRQSHPRLTSPLTSTPLLLVDSIDSEPSKELPTSEKLLADVIDDIVFLRLARGDV